MPNRLPSTLVALLVVGVACTGQPAVDMEAARAELRDVDRRYTESLLQRELEPFLAFYAADAIMDPPGAPSLNGIDMIREMASALMQDSAFAGSPEPPTVEVSADGTMGYTRALVEVTMTGPDGSPTTERIRDVHIWRKQADGTWKIAVDTWNVVPTDM